MKTEDKKFVRCYSLDDDSPKVILLTDEQVEDIVNFCCNKVDRYTLMLYVDVTFKLGPFFCFGNNIWKHNTVYEMQ